MSNFWNDLTGQVDPATIQRMMGQVQGPNQNAYQIQGMGQYQGQMQGLGQQYAGMQQPTAPDLQGGTAQPMQNAQQFQSYLQAVAQGQQPTAADAMFQQGQQTAARNLQSGIASQQGMNPAMGMRQLFGAQAQNAGNLAGQASQQKLQQQQAYSGMAQQGNQQAYNNQFQNMQQGFANAQMNYTNQMRQIQAQQDIADRQFGANKAQTGYNAELDKNRQAFQMFQYEQKMQAAKDQQAAKARAIHGVINGVLTVGGMAAGAALGSAGGPMGMAMGASMGSQLGGAAGNLIPGNGASSGGSGGMDPYMMQMMMQGNPNMTGMDQSNAMQMGGQGYVGPSSNYYNPSNMRGMGNPFFQQPQSPAGPVASLQPNSMVAP